MKDRASERIEYLAMDDSAKSALIDLSATGVAFIHPTAAKKDSIVTVKIRDQSIEAVVVYCQQRAEGFRIGMHFVNVPQEFQSELKNLVGEFSRGVPLSCQIVDKDE